ncbi:hypothetical protein, partial [Yersinia pestis]|uniref:hypothetical protein n=1 Tax=Yersinia pestis TaxID=632 RepID=UPI001955393B
PVNNPTKLAVLNCLHNTIIRVHLMIQYSQPGTHGVAVAITTGKCILTKTDIIQIFSQEVE